MQLQIASDCSDSTLFNSLIDQFEEDILIVDLEHRILNLNARLLEAWGGSRGDYFGKPCESMKKPDLDSDSIHTFFKRVIGGGKRVAETYTAVDPDGRMHYYHVNAFPLRDETGELSSVVFTRRNITAEMQIEQRLYQSQKMAAIGELSTYIAHEIRNPLFAIGGFANALLRTESLDEAAREKARIILEESQRLDAILKSIINFARPTEQAIGTVDVNELASQTVELMSFGTEKELPISLNLASHLPRVHGNAEMLKQCLINLIKNAQEAMDKGAITVTTRYADGVVFLEVLDNGPGIAEDLRDKIFSPFFSTKDKGSGLGLAMTKKIINEIGGKLFLQSRVGLGTTVSLGLRPVLAVDDADVTLAGNGK